MTELEQTILSKLRQLSVEKQQEVLHFLDFLQQGLKTPPTEEESQIVNEIIALSLKRAMVTPSKSTQEIWDEFERVKNKIAVEYEQLNQNQ
ncbi:hypothetical protein [Gloeothece verrucosa]|uniref:DUF2281 domain-containing protein n=1 Tax=Gloeothece verrucosa (strain PCC 7822) TaxID=497965 RepID=E0UN51_GLOV7|nr:hypothetical protein [Gloeothece verrucosa]ADN18381.1 Protein of unknown function DUF2281 [Gloeothece verrucosa PCC 7822]